MTLFSLSAITWKKSKNSWFLGMLCWVSAVTSVQAKPSLEVRWLSDQGEVVDPEKAGLTLVRSPPVRWSEEDTTVVDEGAFRLLAVGSEEDVEGLGIRSEDENGRSLDHLELDDWFPTACPRDMAMGRCQISRPLRIALDREDRQHPASSERSVQGVLGGKISIVLGSKVLSTTRIIAPQRGLQGASRWWRAKLRVFLVRERPRGAPPFGVTDAIARALTQAQIAQANAVWGQCGISFGIPDQAEITVVDPPGPVMLVVGCGAGLPASGGKLSFRVEGREIQIKTELGQPPASVARRVASALGAARYQVAVSEVLRAGFSAGGAVDLIARRRGIPAVFSALQSTDATLQVCIGSVDFSDGLQHFTDTDAVAGTLEERTLLRALEDGDPRTIEVVMIPSFATGGRIGESFIAGDHGSLRNMILEDRAGIRAGNVSFTLAHELGHVLLDVPGHSDDYGMDTPTRLMDSDAADPSPFGPRRLTLAECERALRQSGPAAAAPLLSSWTPWFAVRKPSRKP